MISRNHLPCPVLPPQLLHLQLLLPIFLFLQFPLLNFCSPVFLLLLQLTPVLLLLVPPLRFRPWPIEDQPTINSKKKKKFTSAYSQPFQYSACDASPCYTENMYFQENLQHLQAVCLQSKNITGQKTCLKTYRFHVQLSTIHFSVISAILYRNPKSRLGKPSNGKKGICSFFTKQFHWDQLPYQC